MEFVHLVGAEDVSRAGRNMIAAASDVGRVVGNLTDYMNRLTGALEEHTRALQDHTEALNASRKDSA